MAALAALAPYLAAAAPYIAAAGTVMAVAGQMEAAKAAKTAATNQRIAKEFEAQQAEVNAGQVKASGQRAAAEQRRRAELVASRAVALAGASGGSVSDPTIVNILSDLSGEGAYRAGVAMYQAEDKARMLNMGADAARREGSVIESGGRARANAYQLSALGSAASGASSMYDKYWPNKTAGNPNAGALDDYELFSGEGMIDPRYG